MTFEWGYETDADYGVVGGIKHERARLVKSTVDIAADYIGAVYEYAISKIQEKEFPGTVESVRKKLVVTVPAIWSDRAKKATLMVSSSLRTRTRLSG